jgi:hypothetical protein
MPRPTSKRGPKQRPKSAKKRASPPRKPKAKDARPQQPDAYCGNLNYPGGHLRASRFVVRQAEIAFDVADVYLGETWELSAIAKYREDGSYSAARLVAFQTVGGRRVPEQESVPLSIRFVLGTRTARSIEVSGTYFVEADSYDFRGVLRRFPQRRGRTKPDRRT